MDWLITASLSATVAIFVAYATARLASYSRDVVGERQKWREVIRKLTINAVQLIYAEETQSKEYLHILSEFRVRLNPDDNFDNEIIETLEKGILTPDEILARKLLAQISRLLKYDWERAKSEARIFSVPRPNGNEIRRLRSGDYL